MSLYLDIDDDDCEVIPIPMDRETRRRLVSLAAFVRDHPVRVAASLLRDLLRDDEEAHILTSGQRLNA